MAKLGIAAGLTLGVRVGGLLIFGYVGLLLAAVGAVARRRGAAARRVSSPTAGSASGACCCRWSLVAYPVMLLFWPWAQQAPIDQSARRRSRPSRTRSSPSDAVRRRIRPGDRPALGISAGPYPAGAARAGAAAARRRRRAGGWLALRRAAWPLERGRVLGCFLLGFAILFPVAYAIAIKAVLFDGMRHFIFVLPPIAVRRGARRRPRARPAARAVACGASPTARSRSMARSMSAIMAHAASRRIRLLQRLHRRRARRARPVQARLLGQFLCRGGAGPRGLSARRIRRRFHGPRFHRRGVRPAGLGRRIISRAISSTRPTASGAEFFIAFTKDDCDKALPGQGDLSRRAHGHAAVAWCSTGAPSWRGRRGRRRRPASERGPRWSAANTSGWPRSKSGCGGSAACTPISSRPAARRRAQRARRARCRLRHRRVPGAACGRAARGALRFGVELDAGACRSRARKSGRRSPSAASMPLPFADALASMPSSAPTCCAIAASSERAALAGLPPLSQAGRGAGAQPAGLSLALSRRMTSRSTMCAASAAARLRALLAAAGFARVRARYWNSLLFPLMVLRRKLLRRRAGASESRCCRRRSSGSFRLPRARAQARRGGRAASLRRLDPGDGGEAMTASLWRSASSSRSITAPRSIGELVRGAANARRAGRARDHPGQ